MYRVGKPCEGALNRASQQSPLKRLVIGSFQEPVYFVVPTGYFFEKCCQRRMTSKQWEKDNEDYSLKRIGKQHCSPGVVDRRATSESRRKSMHPPASPHTEVK